MFLPIGDDQVKGGHYPIVSYSLIAINILIFVYQASMHPEAFNNFIMTFGAIPNLVLKGEGSFTLFSSMFLHGSWMHLLGNMVFLWIFGDNIEATIGSARFTLFYIAGGLAAHAAHMYFNTASMVPTVGASGAISAVMGAYLIMFPKSRIKTIVFFFIVYIPAFLFLLFWIGQQVVAGYSELQSTAIDGGGVAWWAHIGGFVYGVLAGLYYHKRYPVPCPDCYPKMRRYNEKELV